MTIEQIYRRYTTALDRVTGQGVWMDAGAVRLAMQLAIDDALDVGIENGIFRQAKHNQEYASQISRLAEYLVTCGHDEEVLLDCAPAQIVDRAVGVIGRMMAERETTADIANWLAANLEVVVDGDTPVQQAVNALTYYHDKVAAQANIINSLETALDTEQERAAMLRRTIIELQDLYDNRGIDLANERAAADLLRAQIAQLQIDLQQALAQVDYEAVTVNPPFHLSSPPALSVKANGNGGDHNPVAGIDWSSLSAVAADFRVGVERGVHTWRKLLPEIRLELVQCVLRQFDGRPMTMAEFDAIRPDWMPVASAHPNTFKCAWRELPSWTLPLTVEA